MLLNNFRKGCRGEIHEKVNKKRRPKVDAKNGTNDRTHPEGRRVGRAAPSNVLNISKRLVFVL